MQADVQPAAPALDEGAYSSPEQAVDFLTKYWGVERDTAKLWETLQAKEIIVATGSQPRSLPHIKIDGKRPRPCLQHYIHRCLGPCVAELTTPEQYQEAVKDVKLFLEGRNTDLVDRLYEKMQEAAAAGSVAVKAPVANVALANTTVSVEVIV